MRVEQVQHGAANSALISSGDFNPIWSFPSIACQLATTLAHALFQDLMTVST
jgi:hypothetical protein